MLPPLFPPLLLLLFLFCSSSSRSIRSISLVSPLISLESSVSCAFEGCYGDCYNWQVRSLFQLASVQAHHTLMIQAVTVYQQAQYNHPSSCCFASAIYLIVSSYFVSISLSYDEIFVTYSARFNISPILSDVRIKAR